MVDPIIIGASLEAIRMAMQLFLTLAVQAGMSEEQISEMLVSERTKFYANRPDLIPEPPE